MADVARTIWGANGHVDNTAASVAGPRVPAAATAATPLRPLRDAAHADSSALTDIAGHAPARVGALQEYLASSIYPPNSRPLSSAHQDLLFPNRRHEQLRRSSDNAETHYRFSADAYWVNGAQVLSVWLESFHNGEPRAAEVVSSTLSIVGYEGADAVRPFELNRRGQRLEARLSFNEMIDTDEPLRLMLSSRFRIAGGALQKATFHIVYSPAENAPARFTGKSSSSVRDGSLCVDVEVEVSVAGRYVFDANLKTETAPVAWTRAKPQLAVGTQQIALCFFGKVLVDSGALGPYRLTQLRGALHRPGQEPDMQQMAWFDGEIEVPAVPLSELSAEAYNSAFKQRKISMLRALERRGGAPTMFRAAP